MFIFVADSCAFSSAAWKWNSVADLQCWTSFSILCFPHTNVILCKLSISHSFLMQSIRHSYLRSFAVGIPVFIFGFRHSHFRFHCVGTSFVSHKLQSDVNIVFSTSSGQFLIKINSSPVGDGVSLVDAVPMTVLYYFYLISLLNITSISDQNWGFLKDVWYPIPDVF